MTKFEYNKYKSVSNKVVDLLINENCSSLKDINIIHNILMGHPYMLDTGYLYHGEYYGNLMDIPKEGLEEFAQRYGE